MYTRAGTWKRAFSARKTHLGQKVTPEIVKRAVAPLPRSLGHHTSPPFRLPSVPPPRVFFPPRLRLARCTRSLAPFTINYEAVDSLGRPAKCIETIFRNGRETLRLPATDSFVSYCLSLRILSFSPTRRDVPLFIFSFLFLLLSSWVYTFYEETCAR